MLHRTSDARVGCTEYVAEGHRVGRNNRSYPLRLALLGEAQHLHEVDTESIRDRRMFLSVAGATQWVNAQFVTGQYIPGQIRMRPGKAVASIMKLENSIPEHSCLATESSSARAAAS